MDHAEYCRDIETYLCKKNDGHLIRIVGPQFEQVCRWADLGVPLSVAFRGIDRCCDRHHAKGTRRRPVRIEFCEADILDLFDDWRRAVGVAASPPASGETAEASSPSTGRKPALAGHLDRGIARLLASGRGERSARFGERVDEIVRQLDGLASDARHARGEARSRIVDKLGALDGELLSLTLEETDTATLDSLGREADAELAPFGSRMTTEAREHARTAAVHRLARERLGVPSLEYS